MELRLLTEMERATFRSGMLEARASKGGRFRETARSRVSEIQLAFARLYGIFDEADPNHLLSGFSIHCLNEFSQSFPIPNLSHLPASGVYEAGQLWASSHESAQALRKGAMVLLGVFQAQALLIYPLVIPRDVSTLYRVFKRVGPPFELPFAETVTGEKVYMQAMLLEGDELRRQVELASCDGYETRSGHSVITFEARTIEANNASDSSRRHQTVDKSEPSNGTLNGRLPGGSERPATEIAILTKRLGLPLTTSLSGAEGVAVEARPNELAEDPASRRWSWCEFANQSFCPFRRECELQCREKGLFICKLNYEKNP